MAWSGEGCLVGLREEGDEDQRRCVDVGASRSSTMVAALANRERNKDRSIRGPLATPRLTISGETGPTGMPVDCAPRPLWPSRPARRDSRDWTTHCCWVGPACHMID